MKSEEVNQLTKEGCGFPRGSLGVRAQCSAHAVSGVHGQISELQLWEHYANCEAESSDMLLYLAGVNEHAVLRIVGSKRWSVAHFLRTIQYPFEYGGRFLAA
jgi:hypothetical protein